MAFTPGEFLRGALIAFFAYPLWGTLVMGALLLPSDPIDVLRSLPLVLLYLTAIAMPWMIGALLIGLAPAWFLGRALRRKPRKAVHIAAFALLGAVIGTVVLLGAQTVGGLGPTLPELFISQVIAGSLTVATGWWVAARWALQPRRRTGRRTQADRDAAVEDRLLDSAG